jgi:hypothetical protein
MAGLVAAVAAVAGTAMAPQAGRAAAPPPARSTSDASSAQKLALATETRVEVMSERSEYVQMFAEPTGRFTFESAVTPQRVHRADGSWADVDLNLTLVDGVIRPRASVADVRLSAGGPGPLVTLVKGGKTLTLSWPLGSLHPPTLDGDSATYANVLPDVDLVVRATRDGFSHVLVVRTATAAADSRVRQISFDLGGTAQVRRAGDGSLMASAGGTIVARAAAPMMWDSTTTATASAKVTGVSPAASGGSSEPSTATAPADTARTSPVGTELTSTGDLVLKPDAALLATAKFPLFIDPAWSTDKSRWAYSTSTNKNNTDLTRARVGADPNSGIIYRSYFEFPTTAIKNKFVYDAYVQMKVGHTASCTNTPNTLLSSSPISGTPRMAWKSTSWYLKMLAQVSSHANEGTGCADSPQPDVTVNFNTDAVRDVVQSAATAGSPSIAFVLSAVDSDIKGESTDGRWKKYYPDNAKLITDVDAIPGKPTEVFVDGTRCNTTTLGIGTTGPKFAATMPDADATQDIRATWEWQRLTGSTWTAMPAPATSSAPAGKLAASAPISGGVNESTYRFRVNGTDPAPYNRTGAWSDWCQFTIDTSDPPVSGVIMTQPPGPGRPGQFKIRSEAADLSKFRYGWNAAVTEVAPTGTETVDGVVYRYATVTLTAPKYGLNTLFLQAVDTTANVGDGSIPVPVDRASPPVAKWGLETYATLTSTEALADGQPSLAGNTPLTGSGATFTDTGRLIGGKEATFNGSSALTTTSAVVDTSKSFAVAAWVKLNTLTGSQTFVAQDGTNTTNFQLQYRSDNNAFCFTIRGLDQNATTDASHACAPGTPTAGRWTHVAGTFDAAEKKLRIWVDGVLQQESAAPTTSWSSGGPLRIGNRKNTSTTWVEGLSGAVADVQIFDRALVQEDLTGDATDPADAVAEERGMLTPIEVARWGFDDASPCWDETTTDDSLCEEPDNDTGFAGRLKLSQGVDVVGGANGMFGAFDNQQLNPDDPTDPFYGTTTLEHGLSQRNTGSPATPSWQNAPVLRTDQSFTVTIRVHVGSLDDTMTALAPMGVNQSGFYLGTRMSPDDWQDRFEVMFISADTEIDEQYNDIVAPDPLQIDDAGVWHNLALVYDAGTHQARLFVNGVRKAEGTQDDVWQADGPMIVGGSWYRDDGEPAHFYDPWFGGIDDVRVFQGAMTDAQVAALNAATES